MIIRVTTDDGRHFEWHMDVAGNAALPPPMPALAYYPPVRRPSRLRTVGALAGMSLLALVIGYGIGGYQPSEAESMAAALAPSQAPAADVNEQAAAIVQDILKRQPTVLPPGPPVPGGPAPAQPPANAPASSNPFGLN